MEASKEYHEFEALHAESVPPPHPGHPSKHFGRFISKKSRLRSASPKAGRHPGHPGQDRLGHSRGAPRQPPPRAGGAAGTVQPPPQGSPRSLSQPLPPLAAALSSPRTAAIARSPQTHRRPAAIGDGRRASPSARPADSVRKHLDTEYEDAGTRTGRQDEPESFHTNTYEKEPMRIRIEIQLVQKRNWGRAGGRGRKE